MRSPPMKNPMQYFALTKDELSAIRVIAEREKLSIGELASNLHISNAWASRIATGLEQKGLAEKKRRGIGKTLEMVDRNHAQLLAEMIRAEPYIPWEKVLSYSNMAVLLANATGEKDFQRGLSKVTEWRQMRNLASHGLLTPKNNKLDINLKLSRFINSYADFISAKFASKVLPRKAIMIWEKGYSYFFKLRASELKGAGGASGKRYIKTALSGFPRYGIAFITDETYYYYEPGVKKLDLEDIVLHTLLIDRGSKTYFTYALLLLFKKIKEINFDILKERSKRYDLLETIENIIRFVNSKGQIRTWPLPKWNELREQARMYGVEIERAN